MVKATPLPDATGKGSDTGDGFGYGNGDGGGYVMGMGYGWGRGDHRSGTGHAPRYVDENGFHTKGASGYGMAEGAGNLKTGAGRDANYKDRVRIIRESRRQPGTKEVALKGGKYATLQMF